MLKRIVFTLILGWLTIVYSTAQKVVLDTGSVNLSEVTVEQSHYKGRSGLKVQGLSSSEKTLAILKEIDFHNGTIEGMISGQPSGNASEDARGFVGIAFRVSPDVSKMEVFYIRPTNGRADDQIRRNHSTQYISVPGYPWEKFRKESPGKYESYADMVAAEWIKVKIEVRNDTAKLYLNDAQQPALIVNDLKQGKSHRGSIGLWVGPGTLAYFTAIKLTKED
ncbi:hypothetical protein [Filimonas effusa]|uniref:DUF1080 domain-containing protein n=1 Tax=Filimonas effusa TaxID=2508721 RepID=A0A4Q1D9N4_9BACT|nr:hypothetical protein [Filimonas effusa]RXK86104.1 hypothetical protein ESB13_04645 [Filimonas effusa]